MTVVVVFYYCIFVFRFPPRGKSYHRSAMTPLLPQSTLTHTGPMSIAHVFITKFIGGELPFMLVGCLNAVFECN